MAGLSVLGFVTSLILDEIDPVGKKSGSKRFGNKVQRSARPEQMSELTMRTEMT